MVTIHEVAKAAGVSISTVSYALSGKRSISATTRARIDQAVAFLALLELLRRGEIHPVVAERLPLSDARRAHELLERSAATGKLVLVP